MMIVYLINLDKFCCSTIFCSLLSLFVQLIPEKWAWLGNQCHGNMTPSCEAVAIAVFSRLLVLGSIGGCYSRECQLFVFRQP